MTTCKFDQFKATAHPSQSKTNVMFCGCKSCIGARAVWQAGVMNQTDQRIRARFEALTWTPPKPTDEAEEETAP